jgi:hypothetical protein
MESHEVLKKAVTAIGAKSVAADMSLSSSLIYKWCEPKDSPEAGGADNPLDRIEKIYQLTGDAGPISWLCQQADGFFVSNKPQDGKKRLPLLSVAQEIIKEFSELLDAVSKSVEDDGKVDEQEAVRIRGEWEDLKSAMEGFVIACEKGEYNKDQFPI